jgi:hypothetical protein
MKLLHILNILLCLVFTLGSCTKEEQLMYQDNDPRVYFPKSKVLNGIGSVDSVHYSFALEPETHETDTIYLHFRIIGLAKDYDRMIKMELTEESTAKERYHFEYKDLYIPANAYEAEVPVILHRRPGLKDSIVRAELRITESTDFKPGYEGTSSATQLDKLSYNFTITDMLAKPAIWETLWANLFGSYSNTKLIYLTQWTGYRTWNSPVYFPQDQNLMIQQARLGLYEYEKENGPLYNENNERVLIP